MKRAIVIAIFCAAIWNATGAPQDSDPIDRLVTRLNGTRGLWRNGLAPMIPLPPSADHEDVLAAAVKMIGFEKGRITTYEVVVWRSVRIGMGPGLSTDYAAAVVNSDCGRFIFLCKPDQSIGWWTRFYEVEEDEAEPDGRPNAAEPPGEFGRQ